MLDVADNPTYFGRASVGAVGGMGGLAVDRHPVENFLKLLGQVERQGT